MHLHHKYIKQMMLVGLGLLFLICVPQSHATEMDRLEQEHQDTLEAIDHLKDSINSVQRDIEGLEVEKNNIQKYIVKLDQEMSSLVEEIGDFEQKIEKKLTDIEETGEELSKAQETCDQQYEEMKRRIQVIYETQQQTWLEMLCSAGSIAEFLNRAEQVVFMARYDRDMMDKLVETKETIALKEETLKVELEELKMMQEELENQKVRVNTSINNKKGELTAKNHAIDDAEEEQDDYEKELEEQEKLLNQIEEKIAQASNPDIYEGNVTGFIWPCPGYTRISSYFGARPQPVPGASTNHKGVDLAAPGGTAILASAAGVVTTSTYSPSAGNYIVIAHGNGVSTVYMHCSALLVSSGETVEQGQTIGKVGSTGYSSGNHLHFGVIKNGAYVDPLGYISP